MRLIPNNITVTEQFAIRNRLDTGIKNWAHKTFNTNNDPNWALHFTDSSLQQLERECGIRCFIAYDDAGWHGQTLGGYIMTNEKKYMWFALGCP
jgi:hypothetical protein